MAGIYLHIPFCKQACNYCNFYFSTSTFFKTPFLERINEELIERKGYLKDQKIQSIYFGGGTPSILESDDIKRLLETINQHYEVANNPEITLEANPDDLTKQKLQELQHSGINRLSIGTQSFHDKDLQFMRRAHNAEEALQSILEAQNVGFSNISIDLIYGVPTLSKGAWEYNLKKVSELGVQHLSCYALTVEEGTALFHQIRKGQVSKVSDDQAALDFNLLQSWAEKENWDHYEVSNLCKNEKYSIHNTSYWQGEWYLGVGPGAHSFNGTSRQWNKPNLKGYVEKLSEQTETEQLSKTDQFNEYIMTGLRTKWGIDRQNIEKKFPEFYPTFEQKVHGMNSAWLQQNGTTISLSNEGKFYADGIASDFFELNDATGL